MTLAAMTCAAIAMVVALAPAAGAARLATIMRRPARTGPAADPDTTHRRWQGWADGVGASVPARVGASLLAAVAVLVLAGGVPGALLGTGLGVVAWHGLARLEPGRWRRDRDRIAATLPLAADLVAAALAAGCPPVVAVETVGAAIGGPLGRALLEAAAASRVGADPTSAWAGLLAEPVARPVARALVAAMSRGTSPGPTLRRAAVDARDAARWAGEARARALGARAAAPLGLCFLPAFVLLGVVPIVATSAVFLP